MTDDTDTPRVFPVSYAELNMLNQTGSRWTTLYPIATDDEGLQTVVLGLDFRLREDHFRHGVVSLKCKAELFDIYYSGREVKVHRRSLAQRSSPLGGWSAGQWRDGGRRGALWLGRARND
ncbi:hypothetical protein FJT64_017918 [Amphibalanus amphitrite]|uniref:Uncharacterized protein n=1 Tax=Amphibalanus amphitrite TaxID=1232801 RepID=A0A6A4WZ58_AMPAM|nr:hypothetical protein FJT64_017918 [Amphibalanus amphitrite]